MTTTGAEDVRWDLSPMYAGLGDPAIDADLDAAEAEATSISERLHGKVAELDAPALRDAVEQLERLSERVDKVATFAYLNFATDTADPARGALLQKVEERSTAIGTKVLFFDLEWAAVPDERADGLLRDPALEKWDHLLRSARRFRPHLLSEPEEKLVAEKSVTGRSAWVRLFTQVTDAISVPFDGETLTLDEVLAKIHDPDRAARHRAGAAVTEALRPGLPVRTFILNTVAADAGIDDRLRQYPSWIAARNLGNEIDDATVDALVTSVTSRYDLPERWYKLKANLLGLDELTEHDRYAPLLPDEHKVSWDEARDIVLDSYGSF